MIKVVHIVSGVGGGAGIAALRLHRGLMQQGSIISHIIQKADTTKDLLSENVSTLFESTCLFYRLKRKLGLTPEMKHNKLIATFPRNNEYEIATFATSSYRIEEHPLVRDADIIHLHWVANFLNYPTFFKSVKQPIVWTLHDKNPFHGLFHTETDERNNTLEYGNLDKKVRLIKEKYLNEVTNIHIVTPSLWLLIKSKESKALSSFPHVCIANSIDTKTCNIDHEFAKKKLNLDNGKKTLMFIAHSIDIPRRGFFIMKESFSQLSRDLCDFNLVTVGGSKIELNNQHINHVHYESTNDSELLNTIYSAADIQILPTQEDNLPNVMLESLANGTPIISFANGGMAEHISTGQNGILVDTIGVEPLTKAIENFLNDKYTFNRETIKQYALDHFDEEKQVLQYVQLYKDILNK